MGVADRITPLPRTRPISGTVPRREEDRDDGLPYVAGTSPFHIKGNGYGAVVAKLDDHVGRSRWLSELPSESLREFFEAPLIDSGWYDVFPMVPLVRVGAELTGRAVDEFCRARAAEQAETDSAGIYRVLLRVAGPRALAERLPRLTSRYYNFGPVLIESDGPRSVMAVRTGVPELLMPWWGPATESYVATIINRVTKRGRCVLEQTVTDGETFGVPTVATHFRMSWD